MLTMRIVARDVPPGSDAEHIADRRELCVTEQRSEFLLFSRHADVMPYTIPPRHRGARLIRVQFPRMEVEKNGPMLVRVDSPDAGTGQSHRQEPEVPTTTDRKIH